MDIKINVGLLNMSIKNGEVEIFDGNTEQGVRIEFNEWRSVKEAVDKLIADNKKTQEKRQPIKEQTLDEFNNARQVVYGNNVQVEPLTDSNTPPDNDSDSYVQEYPDYFIFTNKKTGKETKVDK